MAGEAPKVNVMDLFNPNKKIIPMFIPRGETDGMKGNPSREEDKNPAEPKRAQGFDYVKHFQTLEMEQSLNVKPPSASPLEVHAPTPEAKARSMLDVDGLSTLGGSRMGFEADGEELTSVYKNYDFTPAQPKGLLIEDYKDNILKMVDSNQAVVIVGATGCGKSTQVPQYILDQHASRNLPCNIVVTQPRRIAATSIARRVCYERSWELGSVVGYQIGLDPKQSPDTRLLFCTTGVLLEKLIHMEDMNKFTHVILDEVHERNQDMDFLMLLVRKRLRTNSRNVKVVLMSATFDTERFSNYFAVPVNNNLVGAPVIDVKNLPQHRRYKVHEHFLDDLMKATKERNKVVFPLMEVLEEQPRIPHVGYDVCEILIRAILPKHDDEDEDLAKSVKSSGNNPHCVLVFLPGLHNIEEMHKKLTLSGTVNKQKWQLIPLHSSLTREEQARVFKPALPGHRKIILCTDIAESSITVPDVKYVIDFCLGKELIADSVTNFTSLKLTWASRTNCKQRAGRTGRVINGHVFRLVPKRFYYDLSEERVPEMLRCPLEITVLKCKLLNIGEPRAVLSLALDPPNISNIERAILLLKEAGGLLPTCRGQPMQFDGDITFLGRIMACLPVSIHISKLIALGYLFCLLDETIIIGATMSAQNVFSTPFKAQIAAYNSKLTWADSSCCDAVAHLQAFTLYQHYTRTGFFKSTARNDRKWAEKYFLNLKGIHEANELVDEIKRRLKDMNITSENIEGGVEWSRTEKALVLKIVLAGAFYPNYFVRCGPTDKSDVDQTASRKVKGHDVRRSVFLTGLPANQPGALYTKAVKDDLKECGSEAKVYSDCGTFVVEFGSNLDQANVAGKPIPGNINMAVYRAVKRRMSGMPVKLMLLSPAEAMKRAEAFGLLSKPMILKSEEIRQKLVSTAVPLSTAYVEFIVSQVQSPEKFWVQLANNIKNIENLFTIINGQSNLLPLTGRPREGDVYAAPFRDMSGNLGYYRAKILRLFYSPNGVPMAEVSFMDYGSTADLLVTALRSVIDIPSSLWDSPAQAVECRLCCLRPSPGRNMDGTWSEEAIHIFKCCISGPNLLLGKVYSFVDGVLALEVLTDTSGSSTVNEILLAKRYALIREEDSRSKEDNAKRERIASFGSDLDGTSSDEPREVAPPTREEAVEELMLKGPFSPLEMKVYGCNKSTAGKEIRLDGHSVNAVLLDPYPEDPHERLLVGAAVSEVGPDRLILRNTTLFPNLKGMPALMGLLFAPNVELLMDKRERKFIGILCGLGYDPQDGTSLFPEHDLSIRFDCVFDDDDFTTVNYVRLWMSTLLRTEEGETLPSISLGDRRAGQIKLKEYLVRLIQRNRQSQTVVYERHSYKWGQLDPTKLMVAGEDDERFVFKLIKKPVLATQMDHSAILEHIEELYRQTKRFISGQPRPDDDESEFEAETLGRPKMNSRFGQRPPDTPINTICKLCNVNLSSVSEVSIHMRSSTHRRNEFSELELN